MWSCRKVVERGSRSVGLEMERWRRWRLTRKTDWLPREESFKRRADRG